jgi:hypothetical protein
MLGSTWWSHALVSRRERRQKEFIHGAFARYLHPDWVEQLMANPDLLALTGERRGKSPYSSPTWPVSPRPSELLPPTSPGVGV